MKTWIATAVLGVSAALFGMGETAQAHERSFPGGRYSSGHSHGHSHYGHSHGHYGHHHGYRIQPVWPSHGHVHRHYDHHHHGHYGHGHQHNYNRYGSRFQFRFSF